MRNDEINQKQGINHYWGSLEKSNVEKMKRK